MFELIFNQISSARQVRVSSSDLSSYVGWIFGAIALPWKRINASRTIEAEKILLRIIT